jgi:L-amino acid N-acyltransferase YncA
MNSIRTSVPADLPRLVEIYNQAICSGTVTGDTVPFGVEERRGWFDTHEPCSFPLYVCESDEQVLGYLSVSPYRGRPAMQRTAEISYYVDYAHHGKGIGSALMGNAIRECPRMGKKVLLAILLEGNLPSLKLLEKFSFRQWGFLPEVAEFSSGLRGHLYFGRNI